MNARARGRTRSAAAWLLTAPLLVVGCGKKGPPLAPLVRLPAAPAELAAERRGNTVDIHLVVPSANTDGSRPATIERVEVYSYTAPPDISDDQLLKMASRVGAIDVKPPADPDEADAGESGSGEPNAEAGGVDQGATAHTTDPNIGAPGGREDRLSDERSGVTPQVAQFGVPSRVYVAFGVARGGRRGPFSRRARIPLVPAPSTPPQPDVSFDDRRIVISLAPPIQSRAVSPDRPVLPSRQIAPVRPDVGFHVYELGPSPSGQPGAAGSALMERRLTKEPLPEPQYADNRIEWGVERCYSVTVVHRYEALVVESPLAAPRCVVLADTFAPPVPTGVTAIESEGAVTLIWDPSTAADLTGYIVLRGEVGAQTLVPLTNTPVQSTQFTDSAASRVRLAYAVQAVDTVGNVSEPSARVEAAAR